MLPATALPRSRFGHIGWDVARLGVGTYHLTSDRGVSRQEAREILRRALALGVSLVDTAPMYGLGEAEDIVGEALHESIGPFKLVNKIGYFKSTFPERADPDAYRDPALIRAQFERSLARLSRDEIDLLLIHESDWDEWWDGELGRGPVMEAVDELIREGRVAHVGLSVRDPERARVLLATGKFDAMQFVHYRNLVWQEHAEAVLFEAARQDTAVIIGAPYRQGLLADGIAERVASLQMERRPDLPPGILERMRAAQQISREAGMSMLELGLRYLMSDPRHHVVLAGPRSVRELEENVAWAARGPLPPDLLTELARLREIAPGTWVVSA